MNAIEKIIARRVAEALIAAGKPVTVDFNEADPELVASTDIDAIITACDMVDECWMLVDPSGDGYDRFVFFVWGNGEEGRTCISDYSTGLSAIIEPVGIWSDELTADHLAGAYTSLTGIVREMIYGDGTDASIKRTIDLCNEARASFNIERIS